MSLVKMQVGEVMSPQAHTIRADEKLDTAKDMLKRFGVRHLPVLDGGRLVGVLSNRDIALATSLVGGNSNRTSVEDACTQEVYVTHPDSNLATVAQEMAEKKYGCTVVTDPNDTVVGIFTTTDACRALAQVLSPDIYQ